MFPFWAPLIYFGVYAATLSSALASIVGAPRVLQKVASDDIIPFISIFKELNPRQDPERGYYFTYVVAMLAVMIGDLNLVAPLITMFFMITYAILNFACFWLSISGSPGWRPGFKWYNKWGALFGCIICIGIMILINPWFAAAAGAVAFALDRYIRFVNPAVNWGSALDARRHMKAMEKVQSLRKLRPHVKNFRPGFLVMVKSKPHLERHLIDFVRTLEYSYGTNVYVTVEQGSLNQKRKDIVTKSHKDPYKERGFFESLVARDIQVGAQIMMQVGGLGRLRPNTLVMGFPERWYMGDIDDVQEKCRMYSGMLYDAITMDHGFMVCRNLEEVDFSNFSDNDTPNDLRGAVDVWWLLDSGGLELLVPHLMSLHHFWKKKTRDSHCPVRLFLISAEKSENQEDQELDDFRRLGAENMRHLIDPADIWKVEIQQLLQKLRMDWTGPLEIKSGHNDPEPETLDDFRKLCHLRDDDEIDTSVMRWLRVSELIQNRSHLAACIYVAAPFPDPDQDHLQYMGLLDFLSRITDKPVALIRGCEKNVVTIHQD
eukprot:TRINITY_DN4536_c0_g1_i2.p1 TRINITY_DN4536_c0_g1~~TRINITY_DN4536_c0_g1_i2.p1  ORF type:complete len:544 (+),score=72.52 TRINITY_DN4536_c0_g1_i2:211-1842(+)